MGQPSNDDPEAPARRDQRMWNWRLGGGALLVTVGTFCVPYAHADTRTLFTAMTDLLSSEGGGDTLITLLSGLTFIMVLATTCLPILLWVERNVARRPLSRRMRILLIAQGIVGLVGVVFTFLMMDFTLSIFMFGGGSIPVSPGFFVILIIQTVFSVTSLVWRRRDLRARRQSLDDAPPDSRTRAS